jgi:hypothetical protein
VVRAIVTAGLAYEDSPTISYAPVDAQAFEREWLVPVKLETLALLMQAASQDGLILLLVERMNGTLSGSTCDSGGTDRVPARGDTPG